MVYLEEKATYCSEYDFPTKYTDYFFWNQKLKLDKNTCFYILFILYQNLT